MNGQHWFRQMSSPSYKNSFADPDGLAARLGPELYALRRKEEDDRIAEFCQYVSPKFTYVKIHFIRPTEVFLLKLFGLYAKGRREFRNLEVVENDIAIPGLPAALDGYTIMQMSDLHIDIPVIELLQPRKTV